MKSTPWALVVVLLAVLFFMRGTSGAAVADAEARAQAAEDSVAVLAPIADSLMNAARQSDTVLVQITDTLRVTIERVRVEVVSITDSLLSHTDSIGAELVAELQAAHAVEVTALEELNAASVLWGEGWREAALAMESENEQLRLRGDAWEQAFNAQRRQSRRFQVGGLAVAALAVFAFVR